MSVLKTHRGESGVKFLDIARDLEIYTLRQCMKMPKRYTFFLSTELVRLAQSVLNHAKSANSIYPTNAHEAQLRRDHLTEANNAVQCLVSQLDIAKGVLTDVPDKIWLEWTRLIAEEARLISAVKKSDLERSKSLV